MNNNKVTALKKLSSIISNDNEKHKAFLSMLNHYLNPYDYLKIASDGDCIYINIDEFQSIIDPEKVSDQDIDIGSISIPKVGK